MDLVGPTEPAAAASDIDSPASCWTGPSWRSPAMRRRSRFDDSMARRSKSSRSCCDARTCRASRRASGIWTSARASKATARTGRKALHNCSALAVTESCGMYAWKSRCRPAGVLTGSETSSKGPRASSKRLASSSASPSSETASPVRIVLLFGRAEPESRADQRGVIRVQDRAAGSGWSRVRWDLGGGSRSPLRRS